MLDMNWVMVIVGLVMILAELILGVATGFDLLLSGIAFIIGGVTGNFFHNPPLGILTTVAILLAYIFLGRKFIKKRLHIATKPTNVDRLIGQTATVLKPNQVKIDNEIWLAKSNDKLNPGDQVRITSIDGVTLQVVILL